MSKTDKYKVQVVGPAGRVTYLTPDMNEMEGHQNAAHFDDEDAAGDAAHTYRRLCAGQLVLIQVVPLIEED